MKTKDLERILSVPKSHFLYGESGEYAPLMARAILKCSADQLNFKQALKFLMQVRRHVMRLDLQAAFLSKKEQKEKIIFITDQLRAFGVPCPTRPSLVLHGAHTYYLPLFKKTEKLGIKKKWEPQQSEIDLSAPPLLIRKQQSNTYRTFHAKPVDLPVILGHLSYLWDKTLKQKDLVQTADLIARFEWWFVIANPTGRCAASLSDCLSLVLQLKKRLPIRKKFQHMDWEALTRSLDDYAKWRSEKFKT